VNRPHLPTVTRTPVGLTIDWHGRVPEPGDTVLMSYELFVEAVRVLNGSPVPVTAEQYAAAQEAHTRALKGPWPE
jgi:hypothetical protein